MMYYRQDDKLIRSISDSCKLEGKVGGIKALLQAAVDAGYGKLPAALAIELYLRRN